MKEHIQREMVNELRDIALKYHGHGCLRQLIHDCVGRRLREDEEWWKPFVDQHIKRQAEIYAQLNEKGLEWAIEECHKSLATVGTFMAIAGWGRRMG